MSWILAKKLQDRTQMQVLVDWGSMNRFEMYRDIHKRGRRPVKEFIGRFKTDNPTEFFLTLHKVRKL
jgi:hypothetical protein